MIRKNLTGFAVCVPLVFNIYAAVYNSVICAVISVLLLFVCVGVLPFCHKRENLWAFILVLVCFWPMNIRFTFQIWRSDYGSYPMLMMVGNYVEYFLFSYSLEEIIVALITRLIWRKQLRIRELEEI